MPSGNLDGNLGDNLGHNSFGSGNTFGKREAQLNG